MACFGCDGRLSFKQDGKVFVSTVVLPQFLRGAMMEAIFRWVADSSTLQALSILITFGGFLIFLFKLVWPSLKFAKDATQNGVKRAYIRSIKSILRRVRYEANDIRLILSTMILEGFTAILFLSIPFIIGAEVIILADRLEDYGVLASERSLNPNMALILFISIPVGSAISWLTLYPSWKFVRYIIFLRRHVRRQLISRRSS